MNKRTISLVLIFLLTISILAGCGGKTAPATNSGSAAAEIPTAAGAPEPATKEQAELPDLTGKTLMIYCGAGMQQPFQKIADAFREATGCEMNITFANAAQIQTQISTAQEGAFFIAGAAGEVKPVEEFVSGSVDLVKHIPVLAVAEGNPKGITGIADLGKPEISTVIGDPESTPIGKIAMTAFEDFGVKDAVTLVATTTTAPQLATVITMEEADAAIIWKENCKAEGVEICDTPDMDAYVKTVPAARLAFSEGDVAADAFSEFLASDAAKEIWISFGYELVG